GIGSFMIESIQGSYTNVVGLPLCELIQMLNRQGAITISECGIRISP
ncbi:MAG: Maf family protein, partial [Thermodesulfobacteriota bacterium]